MARSVAHPFLSDAWFDAVETLRARALPKPLTTLYQFGVTITYGGRNQRRAALFCSGSH